MRVRVPIVPILVFIFLFVASASKCSAAGSDQQTGSCSAVDSVCMCTYAFHADTAMDINIFSMDASNHNITQSKFYNASGDSSIYDSIKVPSDSSGNCILGLAYSGNDVPLWGISGCVPYVDPAEKTKQTLEYWSVFALTIFIGLTIFRGVV